MDQHWLFRYGRSLSLFPLIAILLAGFVAAPARSQNLVTAGISADSQRAAQPEAVSPTTDDAWLKKTGSLYYSTAKAGLGGFDCAVHPDWRTLIASSSANSPVSSDDARVVLLENVKINLHAHIHGESTMDWSTVESNGKPLDRDSSALLTQMREATEQTLEGFLQFWTPFVDGSVVPQSAQGLTITHDGTLDRIHAEESDTALTETFSSDVLEHFDVKMNGISIQFQPAYRRTEQGLLVKSFQAHVQPAGVPADHAQEMRVDIEYQTLEGFPIPARLNMETTNTGQFNFVLDGCTVSRLQKPEPANQVKPALQ